MHIDSIIEDIVFKYYNQCGIGNIKKIGNWNFALPKDLQDKLVEFDWSQTTARTYQEISQLLNEDDNEVLSSIGYFNKFETKENIKWRIIEEKDINTDWSLFYKELDEIFNTYKIWISQIPSGCCIPQHLDTIESFLTQFNIDKKDIPNIKRLAVLSEDIQPWHHLWYGKDIISSGIKGDVFSFNFWEPHGGGNLGPNPKYTIQVIGI